MILSFHYAEFFVSTGFPWMAVSPIHQAPRFTPSPILRFSFSVFSALIFLLFTRTLDSLNPRILLSHFCPFPVSPYHRYSVSIFPYALRLQPWAKNVICSLHTFVPPIWHQNILVLKITDLLLPMGFLFYTFTTYSIFLRTHLTHDLFFIILPNFGHTRSPL